MVENNNLEIITADLRKIVARSLIPENGTIVSVGEIAKRTRLSTENITTAISDGISIGDQLVGLREELKTLKKCRPSKTADKIAADIQNEGQRYQRREQFPRDGIYVGEPTSKRIKRDVTNSQIKRAKIVLLPKIVGQKIEETSKEETPEETKIRLKKETRYFGTCKSSEVTMTLVKSDASTLMRIWQSGSVIPLERPSRIRQIIEDSIRTQRSAIIVNWICPAGSKLDFSPTGDTFQRYLGISKEDSFKNDHRLFPRLGLEKDLATISRRIDNLPKPLYLKIVADDNPACLSPFCFSLDGEEPTMTAIGDYSQYVQEQLDILVGQDEIAVSTFSGLLGPQMFREFIETFKNTSFYDIAPYLPPNVIENELRIAQLHMKVGSEVISKLDGYVKKVLRQYAVEGLYLYKLFEDNVIMAWNESTTRTQTMDSLRKKLGLPNLPKISVLHEKKTNVIQDDC